MIFSKAKEDGMPDASTIENAIEDITEFIK